MSDATKDFMDAMSREHGDWSVQWPDVPKHMALGIALLALASVQSLATERWRGTYLPKWSGAEIARLAIQAMGGTIDALPLNLVPVVRIVDVMVDRVETMLIKEGLDR